jgi:hypothetical protein
MKQRALDAAQLAQGDGQAVLARVTAELPEHQRGRHRALLDRGGQPQNFVPMGADMLDVERAADHRLERVIGGFALGNVELGVSQIADARREAEAQEVHQSKDMIGEARRVGVVFFDAQVGLVVQQAIEHIGGVAHADIYHLGVELEEHYTDTAGFTDHVFALMHLLGFRFAPRIRDLGDTKLYISKGETAYDALKPMIGGTLNIKHVRAHWDEILRLATSIKQGTVTASLMLRKLGSYPRQNGLAVALRELGRIERTLFILDWLQSVELRRRVHAGLNKGEARNALARAVFFNRLGEIRDRSFEQQRYRASGLNLVTAAVVLWNTVYLERAAQALRGNGHTVDNALLQYLSPLGWEHINLTGDYLWRSSAKIGAGKFRPLRPLQPA